MTQQTLQAAISELGEDIRVEGNVLHFTFDGQPLACISDPGHDRMRVVTPIIKEDELDAELMKVLLHANFHSALDGRYATGNGVVYGAFIHPLTPLTYTELESAVRQVACLRKNFGTSFSSGELVFGG